MVGGLDDSSAESVQRAVLYRRLPALLYDLFARDGVDEVRAQIATALAGLVPHDALRIVELGPARPPSEPARTLPHFALALEERLVRRALAKGQPALWDDDMSDPELVRLVQSAERDASACVALPLVAHGQPLGAIAVHRLGTGQFSRQELGILQRFGELAALALHAAHARETLERLAFTDALTGLPNRRRLDDELGRQEASADPLSVLFVDFDGLKAVNETLGYEQGDALIVAGAAALERVVRDDEIAARLGGDEFVALLPGLGADEARRRAEEAAAAIGSLPLEPAVASLFRGASVGCVTRLPGEPLPELIRRAVAEMRERKRARRRATDV